MMQPISSLSAIADQYDTYLLDLWGVIHDGSALYPGVVETLTQLRRAGKRIAFISNAPRRAARVEEVLSALGVAPELYDYAVSSGEVGFDWLASGEGRWPQDYYYIGPVKDAGVLDGLSYKRVQQVDEAGFLLNAGFGTEEQSDADWTPLLAQARDMGLPMLCLNPDLEVVKITGERYPCAGVIAHAYNQLGGDVIWFGKPHPAIYEHALALLNVEDKSRVLAVGDSLDTDIPGAQSYALDSVLVTGGILKGRSEEEIRQLCRAKGLKPSYITARFNW